MLILIISLLLQRSSAAPCSAARVEAVTPLTKYIYYFKDSLNAYYAVSLDEDNYPDCFPGFGSDGAPVCRISRAASLYFFQIPSPIQVGTGVDVETPSDCTANSVVYEELGHYSVEFFCNPAITGLPVATNPITNPLMPNFELTHACACDGAPSDCGKDLPVDEDEIEYSKNQDRYDDFSDRTEEIEFIASAVTFGVIMLIEVIASIRLKFPAKWVHLVHVKGDVFHSVLWALNPFVWSFGWFSVISPLKFLEPTRDWIIDSCGMGFMAGALYETIVNPGKQKVGAAQLTAVLTLLAFVPMFIAQSSSIPFVGGIIGFLFSMLLFIDSFILTVYAGILDPTDAISRIPSLLCILIVALSYVKMAWRNRWKFAPNPRSFDCSPYVETLLKGYDHDHRPLAKRAVKRPLMQRMKALITESPDASGFLLPARARAMIVVDLVIVWALFFTFSGNMPAYGDSLEDFLSGGACCHYDSCFMDKNEENFVRNSAYVDVGGGCPSTHGPLRKGWIISTIVFGAISSIIVIVNTKLFVSAVRKDMKSVLKGEWKAVTPKKPQPTIAIINVVKMIGSQAVFMIFGWIITTTLFMIVIIFITLSTVLPIIGVWQDWFWKPIFFKLFIWNNGPAIITTVLIMLILTKLLVRFGLQVQGNHIGMKNPHYFSAFDLFSIMLNFLTGIFSTIKRFVFSIVFGSIVISRVDKPLVPRGFEAFDPAFASYLGFLAVESFYNNPVILTFIHFITKDRSVRKEFHHCGALCFDPFNQKFEASNQNGAAEVVSMELQDAGREKKRKSRFLLARNRWAVALTLLNNDRLQYQRKAFLRNLKEKSSMQDPQDGISVINMQPETKKPHKNSSTA